MAWLDLDDRLELLELITIYGPSFSYLHTYVEQLSAWEFSYTLTLFQADCHNLLKKT